MIMAQHPDRINGSISAPRSSGVFTRNVSLPGGSSVLPPSAVTGTVSSNPTTTGWKSLPTYPSAPPPYSSVMVDEIPDHEIPGKYKEEHFDMGVAFVDCDEESAHKFIDIYEKYIRLSDNEPPRICAVNDRAGFTWTRYKIHTVGEAVRRSTYVFLILTDKFIADPWADLVTVEAIVNTLEDESRRGCIVPVYLKPRKELTLEVPFGLKSLRGVDINRMFKKSCGITSLDQIEDVDSLREEDFDKYFIRNQTQVLNHKIQLKFERKKNQDREKKKFLEEYARIRREKIAENERKMTATANLTAQQAAANLNPGQSHVIYMNNVGTCSQPLQINTQALIIGNHNHVQADSIQSEPAQSMVVEEEEPMSCGVPESMTHVSNPAGQEEASIPYGVPESLPLVVNPTGQERQMIGHPVEHDRHSSVSGPLSELSLTDDAAAPCTQLSDASPLSGSIFPSVHYPPTEDVVLPNIQQRF